MTEKAPAFQFYPDDFMGGAPGTMQPVQTHVYVWLLCLDWNRIGFEYDATALSIWCHVTRRQFEKAWLVVGKCFVERDGRLYNPRLEKERVKQKEWREKSSEGGKKSAANRASGDHGNGKGGARVVEPPYQAKGNIPFASAFPPCETSAVSSSRTNTRAKAKPPKPYVEPRVNGGGLSPISALVDRRMASIVIEPDGAS